MARALVLLALLCACREKERPTEHVVETRAQDAAKPAPVDVASIVPKQPGVFGPWAKYPFGTSHEEIKKSSPELLEYTPPEARRFDGVFQGGLLAAYTVEIDDKAAAAVEAAWGPPKTITDPRGKPHTLWTTADMHFEVAAGTLTITSYLPLASYLGKKGFAFEAERSLVGLPAPDAIAQIRTWADAKHVAMSVEGDAEALAKTIGTTADRVVVVGDGSATPLTKMPTRSIDVSLPPTEGNFEKVEYNATRLRIWLDDKGAVSHYWFDLWTDAAGHASATALLAKTYGKPSTSGESLRYPGKPVVCFPREPRPYSSISVGECK